MFELLIGVSLCICVSAAVTGRHEIVYPSVVTLRSGEKRMNFRAFDQDFKLNLQYSGDVIGEGFHIQSTSDGRTEVPLADLHSIKQKLFRDKRQGTSLHIEEKEDSAKIKGIINSKLRIEPHEEGKRSDDGIIPHHVYEVIEQDTSHAHDGITPPPGYNPNLNVSMEEVRQGEIIYIEVCVVTDTTFSWLFSSSNDLILYICVLINGAQCRYDNLKTITVRIVLTAVIIVSREIDEPYMNDNKVNDGYCVLSEQTLDSFSKYAPKLKISADIGMLVTKRPLCDIIDGKINLGCIGIAYVGTCCDCSSTRCYKVGISEDGGRCYDGADTFAHELAHLMACPHDGDGAVSYLKGHPGSAGCSWDLGHVMSYKKINDNQYSFSSCSENNMLFLINRLACLRTNNTGTAIKPTHFKPGEALENSLGLNCLYYSTHKQKYYDTRCQSLQGNEITTYRFPDNGCGFSCRTKTDSRGYFSYWNYGCTDGEMCNTGKRCHNGKCI